MPFNPHYDPLSELRGACEDMLGYIETQLLEDDTLPPLEREAAPLDALRRAIAEGAHQEWARAGEAGAEWILRNATEDERFDWAVGCPHPAIDRWETATSILADEGSAE